MTTRKTREEEEWTITGISMGLPLITKRTILMKFRNRTMGE